MVGGRTERSEPGSSVDSQVARGREVSSPGEVSEANGTGSDSSALLAGVEAVAGDLGERTEQQGRPCQVGPESARARDARDRSEWDDGGDGAGSREQFAAVKVGAGSSAVAPLRDLRVPVDPEFLDLLDAARDLARHRNPSGDVTTLLRLALQALIQQTESRRRGRAVTATNGDRPSETPGQGEASARGVSVAVVSVQREVAGAPPPTVTEPSGITQACPPGRPLRSEPRPPLPTAQQVRSGTRVRAECAADARTSPGGSVWRAKPGMLGCRAPKPPLELPDIGSRPCGGAPRFRLTRSRLRRDRSPGPARSYGCTRARTRIEALSAFDFGLHEPAMTCRCCSRTVSQPGTARLGGVSEPALRRSDEGSTSPDWREAGRRTPSAS